MSFMEHMPAQAARHGLPGRYSMQDGPNPENFDIKPRLKQALVPVVLPKIGQTRCYWSLLSSDLHFIYLDPVLSSHLATEADALVGKDLLDFVHPDEQASAKADLGNVLDSRTLHGSVTRVRFSRLSAIRRQLGHEGIGHDWNDADKVSLDEKYMAVDVVVNWAAEGLVLCFIHAVVDLNPQRDNDEGDRTGWTNWCGSPAMTIEQIQVLYQRLLVCVPQPASMTRVYQILSNEHDRHLLMSWPPDQGDGHGPTGRDYARLVENVQIGVGTANDAKTSCTRRYKALQSMEPLMPGKVESVFIPHGAVIFACHKVDEPLREPGAMYQEYPTQQQQQQQTHYYDQPQNVVVSDYNTPGHTAPYGSGYHQAVPSPSSATYPNGDWPGAGSSQQYQQPQQWSQNLHQSSSSNHRLAFPHTTWPSSSSSYLADQPASLHPERGHSPPYSDEPDVAVPAPKRRVSPGDGGTSSSGGGGGGGSARASGARPAGITKCTSCKATNSPEWRKGPSGKKELCNACGLRYARSRAKTAGTTPNVTRKKKEKGPSTSKKNAPVAPPIVTVSAASEARYDQPGSAGFPPSPSYAPSPSSYAPSPSVYVPSPTSYAPSVATNYSPSASTFPPSAATNGAASDAVSYYRNGGLGSQAVRMTPSPSPPAHHQQQQQHHLQHYNHGQLYPTNRAPMPTHTRMALPRLDQLAQYSGHSSAASSPTSAVPGREPLTPLSAEPRFQMQQQQQSVDR